LCLGAALTTPALADLQMTQRGSVAFLESTRLQHGDEESFAQFLSSSASPIKIVYLDSFGGSTEAAIAIGRMIRKHGLDTAFHVGRGHCVSACTTMFLGGVHRYYVGGADVADGVGTRIGLGFHPSVGGQEAEGRIASYYSDMGVPNAAQVRYKVYTRDIVAADRQGDSPDAPHKYKLFFVSGGLALKTGVATSVGEPEDASRRDDP
jgi:hypothetical protein